MSDVIHLDSDRHQQTRTLLPWYVTGQLDAQDHARVAAHLADCVPCQAELRAERRLDAEVARLPLDVDRGWADFSRKLGRSTGQRRLDRAGNALRRFADKPGRVGWLVAAQVAFVALLGAAVLPSNAPAPTSYRALGTATASVAGNVLVIFRPEATEREMRLALAASNARVVDGPTAADAYVLHVPAASRDASLTRLRLGGTVVMAQPIGAGPG